MCETNFGKEGVIAKEMSERLQRAYGDATLSYTASGLIKTFGTPLVYIQLR